MVIKSGPKEIEVRDKEATKYVCRCGCRPTELKYSSRCSEYGDCYIDGEGYIQYDCNDSETHETSYFCPECGDAWNLDPQDTLKHNSRNKDFQK